jgi:hypothetical protein
MPEEDSTPADYSREREEIAFGRPIDWERESQYGTVFFGPDKSHQFPPLPIGNVHTLLENGYIDPEYRHNDAPRADRLLEWTKSVQKEYRDEQFEIGLIGYFVSPKRPDSRVALTGISIRSAGPIPERLQRKAVREFSPDILIVDNFEIQIRWD